MFFYKENFCCWSLVPTFTSQPKHLTGLICTWLQTKQGNNKLNLLQNLHTVYIQRPVETFPGNCTHNSLFTLSSAKCLSLVRVGKLQQSHWQTDKTQYHDEAKHHPRSSTSSWCSVSSVIPSNNRLTHKFIHGSRFLNSNTSRPFMNVAIIKQTPLKLNAGIGVAKGLRRKAIPWREDFFSPLSLVSLAHFGDKSWREAKGELLDEEGDTPSILPGESVEEPTLLRLPSSRSGEWLKGKGNDY